MFPAKEVLKAEIVMLGILEKTGAGRKFAVRRHAGAGHVDHADTAKIVADRSVFSVARAGRLRNCQQTDSKTTGSGALSGGFRLPLPARSRLRSTAFAFLAFHLSNCKKILFLVTRPLCLC